MTAPPRNHDGPNEARETLLDLEKDGGNPQVRRGLKRAKLLLVAVVLSALTIVLLFNARFERANYGSMIASSRTLMDEYVIGDWSGAEVNTTEESDGRQTCRIPQLNPWDDSVRPYVKRPKPYSCRLPLPLTRLVMAPSPLPSLLTSYFPTPTFSASTFSFSASTPSSSASNSTTSSPPLTPLLSAPSPFPPTHPFILIEPSLKDKYGNPKDEDIKCCASTVTRGKVTSKKDVKADKSYRIDKCRDFKDSIQVDSDFTLIECSRGKKNVYTDMHSTVVPTDATVKKMASASHPLPPSVVLIGLDSSSRLNIHRAAPKFLEALKKAGAVEMTAYNKVGDNTLPNLLPILSGVSLPDANKKQKDARKPNGYGCWLNNKYTFDECPFIWRNFSEKGYVTMFGEDEPNISIFNYHKFGFSEQPTDHYLRPFYVVAEKRLKKTSRASASWCYANKATLTRVLEYTRSFVDVYSGRAPFFSIVFITGIGHQNAADIELGDVELADFVSHVANVSDELQLRGDGGIFLTAFSDHGMRWGKLRQSPFGWLEERIPFLFIRPPLPSVLSGSADVAVKMAYPNLVANRHRLTSPFDFHFTLSALLNGKGTHPSGSSCEKCYDLIHDVVPKNRTCEGAAIPDNWCACADDEGVSVEEGKAENASSLAVVHLNKMLRDFPQCSPLKIGATISARYRVIPTIKKNKNLKFVVVTFTTVPGEALFEATVFMEESGVLHASSDLSRLNQYGNQSWCVDDAENKLYCYCL